MKSFSKKVVWITGASSGLGAALALALDKEDAQLILSARNSSGLEKTSAACRHPENIFLLPLDLEDPDSFAQKFELVLARFGRLDILINNAGVSQRSLTAETGMPVFRKIMETNFFGPVLLSKLVMAYFETVHTGRVVVISSLTGRVGLPMRSAYCASKFALEGFWNSWRTESARHPGIGLLVVRPGAIRTEIAGNALTGNGTTFNQKDPLIEKGIDPERAASMILKAIKKGTKTLFIGSAGARFLLLLARYWPAMATRAARKAVPGL